MVQGVAEAAGLGVGSQARLQALRTTRGVAVALGLGAWPSAKHLLEARVLVLVLGRRGGRTAAGALGVGGWRTSAASEGLG